MVFLAVPLQRPLGRKGAAAVPATDPGVLHERIQVSNAFFQATGKKHAVTRAGHIVQPLLLLRGYYSGASWGLQLDDQTTEITRTLVHDEVRLSFLIALTPALDALLGGILHLTQTR